MMRQLVFIAAILAALHVARAQTEPVELKPEPDGDQTAPAKDEPKDKDAPKTRAERIEEQRANQKKEVEQSNTNLPVVRVKRIEDAIQVRLEGGELVVRTSIPESESQVKLEVPGYG